MLSVNLIMMESVFDLHLAPGRERLLDDFRVIKGNGSHNMQIILSGL